MIDQFLFDTIKIGFRLIHFVDRHDNRDIRRLRMVNGFNRLGHHTIIRSHNQYDDIGNLGTASPHRSKRFMSWRIEKCNHPA